MAEIAVSAVPSDRDGAAGAIAETSSEIGNVPGIAVLGALAAMVYRLQGPGLAGTLGETLDHPEVTAVAIDLANTAFVSGLHLVAVSGALMLLLGLAAWVWLPRKLPE